MTPEQAARARAILQALRSAAATTTDSAAGMRVRASANDLERLLAELS